jgi:hypothetical protein
MTDTEHLGALLKWLEEAVPEQRVVFLDATDLAALLKMIPARKKKALIAEYRRAT